MGKATRWKLVCPYCHEKTKSGHMVPASLGDKTFLVCESINRLEQQAGMPKAKDWCQTWQKLPALDGRGNPCLCCPSIPATAPLDKVIAVGFGDANVSRDGETVYREPGPMYGQKLCGACDYFGHTDAAKTILCGTCGGEAYVPDPDEAGEPMYWDVAEAEKLAALDPDHDWRITLFAPLHGEVYQRHGVNEWNLVEKNEGSA